MKVSRTVAVAATAAVTAVAGAVAPAPASAAAAACRVYVVCVYNADRSWMGQYSEYTAGYQQVSREDIVWAWNRTPATVYFSYANGRTSCMIADKFSDLRLQGFGNVTGIRLSSARSCY